MHNPMTNLPALREAVAASRLPRSFYGSDGESFDDALRRIQRLEAARKILVDAAPALLDEVARLREALSDAGMDDYRANRERLGVAERDLAAARAELKAMHAKHPENGCYDAMPTLRADLAAAKAVLDGAQEYAMRSTRPDHPTDLRVDRAAWQAWQAMGK